MQGLRREGDTAGAVRTHAALAGLELDAERLQRLAPGFEALQPGRRLLEGLPLQGIEPAGVFRLPETASGGS